jgi:hypothetical protein
MFQYALGRVLSKTNNTEYFLDLSNCNKQYKVDTPRNYELDIFQNIAAKKVSSNILNKFTRPNKLKLLVNHYFKLKLQTYPKNWVREDGPQYHPEVLRLRGNYLIDGYWQTEKYFKKYRRQILEDFSFPKKISKKNKLILNQIKKKNSISIHVRRGDYVTNKKTNLCHGICSINYYNSAINYMRKKNKNPWFIVFSDDIDWCKKNLPITKDSLFISHNTKKNSFEDMRLMSHCKHNIIANSSFSWWGVWLNPRKDKIVIAPKKWFNDPTVSTRDLIPEKWQKI